MKFDFDHINPVTGLPRIKERPEDKIHLMSQYPGRSGFIKMLQNRVNLQSVGNKREAKVVWYDAKRRTVEEQRGVGQPVHFRSFRLGNGQIPQGWIEV